MTNNESTNITGNIAGKKLTQQKKEMSIVEDADTIGQARINFRRGLADSYIELDMR